MSNASSSSSRIDDYFKKSIRNDSKVRVVKTYVGLRTSVTSCGHFAKKKCSFRLNLKQKRNQRNPMKDKSNNQEEFFSFLSIKVKRKKILLFFLINPKCCESHHSLRFVLNRIGVHFFSRFRPSLCNGSLHFIVSCLVHVLHQLHQRVSRIFVFVEFRHRPGKREEKTF